MRPYTTSKEIKFGTLNVETGEMKDGYIDGNGEMRYKSLPFWKDLWYKFLWKINQDKYIRKEYLGVKNAFIERFCKSNGKTISEEEATFVFYREYNILNNKTISVYAEAQGIRQYFNVDAFDKDKIFVEK